MEFIQWYTGSAVGKGEVPLDITRHAIFRLDAIDQTMMDKDTIQFIKEEDIKYWAEVPTLDIEKDEVPKQHLSYRVAEEDEEEYKKKCIEVFSKLLSNYNTYNLLTDFTNGTKK